MSIGDHMEMTVEELAALDEFENPGHVVVWEDRCEACGEKFVMRELTVPVVYLCQDCKSERSGR